MKSLKQPHLLIRKKIAGLQQNFSQKENKREFSYSNLVRQRIQFQYLVGLNYDQFSLVLNCPLPCLHLTPCLDCVGNISQRKLDSATELLAVFTIYRHSLSQGIMAYIDVMTKAPVQGIFIGWVSSRKMRIRLQHGPRE